MYYMTYLILTMFVQLIVMVFIAIAAKHKDREETECRRQKMAAKKAAKREQEGNE